MAASLPHHLIFRQYSLRLCVSFRQKHIGISFPISKPSSQIKTLHNFERRTSFGLGLGNQSPILSTDEINRIIDKLYIEIPHTFDDQGMDLKLYDENLTFKDPLMKFDKLSGYISYVEILKKFFRPVVVHLHYIKETGCHEITARWTSTMTLITLPWKPRLVITGTSIMSINPLNKKIYNHLDTWDSLRNNNDSFSIEALLDIIKQLRIYKMPSVEYQILKRTANYEVRKYSHIEMKREKLSFSIRNGVAKGLQNPNGDGGLRNLEEGFAVVLTFYEYPTEQNVGENEKKLRWLALRDGLKPTKFYSTAQHNPFGTWNFMMVSCPIGISMKRVIENMKEYMEVKILIISLLKELSKHVNLIS